MGILAVVGARPNFMKVAPMARAYASSADDLKVVRMDQQGDMALNLSIYYIPCFSQLDFA